MSAPAEPVDQFTYRRQQGVRMLRRMRRAGFDSAGNRQRRRDGGGYLPGSWQVSASQLFRCSTDREESLHVQTLGHVRVEWVIYADAVQRPSPGWRVRVCYRLPGMSGYQHVNEAVPLPIDCHPADVDLVASHLIRQARDIIADGIRAAAHMTRKAAAS